MLKQASPTLKVKDMRRALEFYARLGFRCIFKLEDEQHPEIPYAVIERDQVKLHLELSHQTASTISCYITVDKVDELYAEFLQAGVTVTHPIENNNYGMRDFHVADEDGNRLGFGQQV